MEWNLKSGNEYIYKGQAGMGQRDGAIKKLMRLRPSAWKLD